MRKSLCLLLFPLLWCLSAYVHAAAQVFLLPTDPRFAEFVYDKNQDYVILTQELQTTHIELGDDEVFLGRSVVDTVTFQIDQYEKHLFVMPLHPDVESSITLLTNKRSYQITLKSVPEGAKWFKHVSWRYQDRSSDNKVTVNVVSPTSAQPPQSSTAMSAADTVSVDEMNYGYSIEGDAYIRPLYVADDGKRTWIKLRQTNDVPALFVVRGSGDYALADYHGPTEKDFLVLQRVADNMVLKLDDREVQIKRHLTKGR